MTGKQLLSKKKNHASNIMTCVLRKLATLGFFYGQPRKNQFISFHFEVSMSSSDVFARV